LDEITGARSTPWNEELNDLYSLPNILQVIKHRRMRWARHVARMRERRGVYVFWWDNLRERDHLEGLYVDGKRILRLV
jgi:hypothetical protein